MRTIQTVAYQYDELSDAAKAKARDWYTQYVFSDSNDWDMVYSDAEMLANVIGIDIDHRTFRTIGGATGCEPAIFFSGFSSQGDGACFDGNYRYKAGAIKAIKGEAPQDKELHRIAAELQAVQKRHFYKLTARMTHTRHYFHSGCMNVDVSHSDDQYRDIGDAEGKLRQLMRDFADWVYSQLQKEYDYQTSAEAVEESIRINEYEFLENGERA